ncbi:MAG: FAD-dependent oxidoreductase [Thermodesulfobacteriota bacterium]|jgi:quinone-modifying oxidoreductase subunit QmoB|nr:MAG: FAD-dependent oxidoreductase [Thermodesulfobacteriota bacterium]
MDKKIGVYICKGCEIGESINIEALGKIAKTPICKSHDVLCGKEGPALIKQDISEGVNAVVIAACSQRVKTEVFQFGPDVLLNRVNLREQVAWCHKPNDEDTQMLAEDTLRMGVVRIQKMDFVTPYQVEDIVKNILVVGGGLAGMTAALETSRTGYNVILVEKENTLGGWVKKQTKLCPTQSPFEAIEDSGMIEALMREIDQASNVKVYTSATIEKISGMPGLFDVAIKQNGNSVSERAGSIINAAGAVSYDAGKLGHLGYGTSKNIVTREQLEELVAGGKINKPSDGKTAGSVIFILCAGSRDNNHLPYCSAICCMESLKQAKYIRTQNPEAKVYIIYKDMRTPGLYENFYKAVQQDDGIFFTKGEVTAVNGNDAAVTVEVKDTLLGENIKIEADLVVLATGMVPATALGEAIKIVVEEEKDKKENQPPPPTDIIIRSNILNLDYRQGPELPPLKYGFPDSHFVCFPYETRRTGIYAAGAVRSPIDLASTMEDATGAALKAIQCVEMSSRGEAVHPRAGDRTYPDFFMQRCTQCKRCTEECPFGTINEDEKCNPLPNPTRCRRCAICMGSCPERIISFKDYSVDMIGSMIKNIEVPEDYEEKPRILILACENDAYPAIDMAGMNRLTYTPYARIIPLRCVGSTNLVWIADALSKGIDGVLLLACKHGDDYQCHMVKGSELASYRMIKVKETLDRLKLESDRIRFELVAHSDFNKIPNIIDSFMETIDKVGPNPYKGM